MRLLRRPPWFVVAVWLARRASEAWRRMDADERADVRRLVTKSRGRPGTLTSAERDRLRSIVRAARGRR